MGRERTKEPLVDKVRKLAGLKGQSEASRTTHQKGPIKGQRRNVNILFKQPSTQRTKKGLIHSAKPGEPSNKLIQRVDGKEKNTTELKQRTKEGYLKSIKDKRKRQLGRSRVPGSPLKAVAPLVIADLFLNSKQTNMVDYKDTKGKTYTVPDSMAAELKEIKRDTIRSKASNYPFNRAYDLATKNNQATFKWDGKNYKSGVYDKIKKRIASLSENEVPIIIEGAYLGKRKKTITEGVKDVKKKQPKKKASKTGLSNNRGPRTK